MSTRAFTQLLTFHRQFHFTFNIPLFILNFQFQKYRFLSIVLTTWACRKIKYSFQFKKLCFYENSTRLLINLSLILIIYSFKKAQSNWYGVVFIIIKLLDAVNAWLCPHCVYVQLFNLNVLCTARLSDYLLLYIIY